MRQATRRIKVLERNANTVEDFVNVYLGEFIEDNEQVLYISDYEDGKVTIEIKQGQGFWRRLKECWYNNAPGALLLGLYLFFWATLYALEIYWLTR